MAGAVRQQQAQALAAIKGLNAAVTTTKLYPPHFPQVAKAVENGFELVADYLKRYGTLSLSLVEGEPRLCGRTVSEKTLGKVPGEDLYQHLRLLQLNHLVITKEIDRPSFNTLLTFFTTSPQLVSNEGGGRPFVNNLGLSDFFPTQHMVDMSDERSDSFATSLALLQKEGRVEPENYRLLQKEIDGETVAGQKRISTLVSWKKEKTKMAENIFAAVADILQGLPEEGGSRYPLGFTIILRNVDRAVKRSEREEMAGLTATVFLRNVDQHGMKLLLLQRYHTGFGAALYEKLVDASGKILDEIVRLMRLEKEKCLENEGKSSENYRHINASIERLLDTEKGKQFLVREKAKKLLEEGENERRNKRIQAGISSILKGDVKSLRSKEVVDRLPDTIASLIAKKKNKAAATLITNITYELTRGKDDSHDLLGKCLGSIGERLVDAEKWEWLERLSVPLMAWVKDVESGDEVLESIINTLIQLQKHYWKNGRDREADKILQLFFAIRTEKLPKKPDVIEVVGRQQDLSVERAPLSDLLQRSVEGEGELIDRRLVMQGPLVARFLFNRVMDSEVKEERLKALQLLQRFGPLLPPLLLEKLAAPMPWHNKRNLIKLLAQTGSKKHAMQVLDYLDHEDIRVQQEAFSCIYNLSGDERKSNLLEALSFATGPIIVQIVRALSSTPDEEVVREIAGLLGDWKHFPDEIREPLLLQAIKLLSRGVSPLAEEALQDFLEYEGRARAKNIEGAVWRAARKALQEVQSLRRETMNVQEDEEATQVASDDEEKQPVKRSDNLSGFAEEEHIRSLFAQGETKRARKHLVELIRKAAKTGRYQEAVDLREWLIEQDPTALNDIIATAEVIEEAKRAGISSDYLHTWSRLHDNLATEEFSALFHSMHHMVYSQEEIIVRQGETKPALFFVNEGKIKLYYLDDEEEVLLKVVDQGQIIGSETFFDASVWTMTAAALARSEVSMLPLSGVESWERDYPGLVAKLQDLTKKHGNIEARLERTAKNRRKYRRSPLRGNADLLIPDKHGSDAGIQMRGELSDISLGGLSMQVRISKKGKARMLLGRVATVRFTSAEMPGKYDNIEGKLVAVRSLYSMNNEFSVHIQFSHLLEEEELRAILGAGGTSGGTS